MWSLRTSWNRTIIPVLDFKLWAFTYAKFHPTLFISLGLLLLKRNLILTRCFLLPQNQHQDSQPITKESPGSCQHLRLSLIFFPHSLYKSQYNWSNHKESTQEKEGVTWIFHAYEEYSIFIECGSSKRIAHQQWEYLHKSNTDISFPSGRLVKN